MLPNPRVRVGVLTCSPILACEWAFLLVPQSSLASRGSYLFPNPRLREGVLPYNGLVSACEVCKALRLQPTVCNAMPRRGIKLSLVSNNGWSAPAYGSRRCGLQSNVCEAMPRQDIKPHIVSSTALTIAVVCDQCHERPQAEHCQLQCLDHRLQDMHGVASCSQLSATRFHKRQQAEPCQLQCRA